MRELHSSHLLKKIMICLAVNLNEVDDSGLPPVSVLKEMEQLINRAFKIKQFDELINNLEEFYIEQLLLDNLLKKCLSGNVANVKILSFGGDFLVTRRVR